MTLFALHCRCGHRFFRVRMACHASGATVHCPACGATVTDESIVQPKDGSNPVAACHHDDGHACRGDCGSNHKPVFF